MEEFVRCLYVLHDRISLLEKNVNCTSGMKDSYGSDISQHIGIAQQILAALSTFFFREDTHSQGANERHDHLVDSLAAILPELYKDFTFLKLEEHAKELVNLKVAMQRHQISDIILPQVMMVFY